MKIKVSIITVILFLLGTSVFALDILPKDTWPFVSKNMQRTGQSLDVDNINAEELDVLYDYPSITEGNDYIIKTLSDSGVVVGEGWTKGNGTEGAYQTHPEQIYSQENGKKVFYYSDADITPAKVSYVEYNFEGLRPGDKYQCFMTVPSEPTANETGYPLATSAYVRVEYQNQNGTDAAVESAVNISRAKYAASWMYCSGEIFTVGNDGKLTIKISNRGKVDAKIVEGETEEEGSYISTACLVLADAVRIVRVPDRYMVGSAVACNLPGTFAELAETVFTNDVNISCFEENWLKTSNNLGMYVNNGAGQANLFLTKTKPVAVPTNMYILKPDGIPFEDNSFTYNFKVSQTGDYAIDMNVLTFVTEADSLTGMSSLRNYNTQTYKIYSNGNLVDTVTLDMSNPGWTRLGSIYNFTAGANCKVVFEPGVLDSLPEANGVPRAYVMDSMKVYRLHQYDSLESGDIGGTYLGVTGFNEDLTEIPLGRAASDTFLDTIGLQTWGVIGAFKMRTTQEVWRYPDNTPEDWDTLEGPVSGGFATSPALLYMPDPVDSSKTILAAVVAGNDGIVYAFDVNGTNPGVLNSANNTPRLLFKGPGLFLPEPEALVGTDVYSGWSKSDATQAAYGGTYLYTSSTDSAPIKFTVTDQMREKAGDYTMYGMNTAMTGFAGKNYSTFKWRIKFWVPPVENSVGTKYKVIVNWYDTNSQKEVSTVFDNITINSYDLGTWKDIDTNISFYAPKEVIIKPVNITGVACVDNIWLSPALPAGESLEYMEGCELAANIDKYGVLDSSANTQSATTLFAPTAAGRVFAYSLKDGIDAKNKIAKLLWTYPKIDDRKTFASFGAPSFFGQKLLYTALPYDSSASWAAYKVGVNDPENYFVAGAMKNYYNTSGTIVELPALQEIIGGNVRSGFMSYLSGKTGKGYSYTALGNTLFKIESNNAEESTPTLVGSMTIDNGVQTTPALVTYGSLTAPVDKYVVNDVTGIVHSFDITNGSADTATAGFQSVKTGYNVGRICSNIVTDGYVKDGMITPNGYFGNNDGFLDVFNAVSGVSIKRLIGGQPYEDLKSLITATPMLLANADTKGESLLNVNGADGFNYTYSTYKAPESLTRWRNYLHTGANWEDILEEMEPKVVDPTDLSTTEGIQVEIVDYETAKAIIDMISKKAETNSIYSKFVTTEPSKEKIDSIPADTNMFLTKNSMIIPEEDWKYIISGTVGGSVTDNRIKNQLQTQRLSDYLLREAMKLRMRLKWDGSRLTGNKSRALFYDGKTAELGVNDPRQNNQGINLEWGDHIYALVWNVPDGASVSGSNCINFEFTGRDVSLAEKRAFSPIRKVPSQVTKVYNFEPYPIMFENPVTPEVGDLTKVTFEAGNNLNRKLMLVEFTLDCNHNKVQTMIGGGWTMGVDLQIPKLSSKLVRFPITRLAKQQLIPYDEYLKTDPGEEWIGPWGFREKFAVNNPLSLQVNSKEYGKTYLRYDDANTYNQVNGVKDGDLQTVDMGNFGHGFLTSLSNVAKAANRGMMNLTSVRFYPGNHTVDEHDHGEAGHSCNFVYDPMPWEYGAGSSDYPAIDYKNVTAVNGEDDDMVSYDTDLEALKPWTTTGDKPYETGRTGDVSFSSTKVENIKYQIEIPRYQPAMNNYVADAIVYCDSNSNGRFDQSGSLNTPGVDCEAHRRFKVTFDVGAEPEILVENDEIYIGDAGHGIGYPLAMNGVFTPYSEGVLGLQTDENGNLISYNPYNKKPEIMKFFKPFRVYNDGNVNLYDISVNKEPLFATFGNSNMSTFNEGLITSNYTNGWGNALRIHENNVVSSLDQIANTDQMNGINSGNFSPVYPFASNGANFGGSGSTLTITKPRVGDVSGSYMSIPDTRKITGKPFAAGNDYNRTFNANNYQLDVRDALDPMVSVAVPVGQPIGEYVTSHPMTVSAKFGTGATITSETGFDLSINVKEAQVTGVPYDKNSAHASLYNIGGDLFEGMNYYSYSDGRDGTPFAFQRTNNTIGLLWSNNKIAERENITAEDIDLSRMPLNIGIAELKKVENTENQVVGTNEHDNFYARESWWDAVAMGIQDNGWPDDMTNGYSVPMWLEDSNLKSSYLQYPYYYKDGLNEKVVFTGKAELKRDGKILPGEYDNRIFWMDYAFTGTPEVTPLSHLDSYSEKKYPVMFMRGGKNWFMWQSTYEGKSSISFTTNDLSANYANAVNGYSPEAKVRMPSAIASAGKPNVIDRNTGDNKIELIYTGINKITGGTDVYMSQYSLDVNNLNNQTFGLSEKAIPLTRVYDEMRRDPKFDFFVAKGLAWARQDVTGTTPENELPAVVVGLGGDPDSENHKTYIDIFTGNTVGFNIENWKNGNISQLPLFKTMAATDGIYPKFDFDSATGVMTITYAPGSTAEQELGKSLVDFSSGVIRFTRIKDLTETVNNAGESLFKKPVTVYASYVPQAISLTEGNGINDGGYAIYDRDYQDVLVMWRKSGANTSNGIYYKIFKPVENNGKLFYNTIFADKKVVTDSSVVNINENSISGFFDNRTKGENDGKGYGKLWLFWGGTKSGKSAVYYETEAIDENLL